ncbi:pyrroline-5-carboxylate reductase-like protein 1 [Leptotrombidium deliense]|uniref:Pyrroline-5-carboxylate reductase-like protein 1 n=1 Tax=Leptotrombidium deliense TaxID=299467 RepID=A0A443SIX6_9ACAR|nr:pyrroline-5-carboxylate reductase-like protein 1 [Leptotrombidium deliense]
MEDEKSTSTSLATIPTTASIKSSSISSSVSSQELQRLLVKHKNYADFDFRYVNIGFIGAGHITEKIVNSILMRTKIEAYRIHISANTDEKNEKFTRLGCTFTTSNDELFSRHKCDVIFLCFHGNVMKTVKRKFTKEPIDHTNYPKCVLSLVVGVSLRKIKRLFPEHEHLEKPIAFYRLVLNSSVVYGTGICTIDVNPDSKFLTQSLKSLLQKFTRDIENVPEQCADYVCCLSSAGLAMTYMFMQSLVNAAEKLGMDKHLALKLVSHLLLNSAKSILITGKSIDVLQHESYRNSSPTEIGLLHLDRYEVQEKIVEAMKTSYERSMQLSFKEN